MPLMLLLQLSSWHLFVLIYANRRPYANFLISFYSDSSADWITSFLAHGETLVVIWWIPIALSLAPYTLLAFKISILFLLLFLLPLSELLFKKWFSLTVNIIVHENLLAHFIQFVVKICFCLLPHGRLYWFLQFFRKFFVLFSLFPFIDASLFHLFNFPFGFLILRTFLFIC